METSSLIIFRVILENILDYFYEVLVNVLFKLHCNSCGRNINFSDDICVVLLIQIEVLSQPYTFYLQVANMVDVVLHLHTLLGIFPLGYFPQ